MFGKTQRRIELLEMEVAALRRDVNQRQADVWTLQGRLDRLLEHLKLSEVTINKTVLLSKHEQEEG